VRLVSGTRTLLCLPSVSLIRYFYGYLSIMQVAVAIASLLLQGVLTLPTLDSGSAGSDWRYLVRYYL